MDSQKMPSVIFFIVSLTHSAFRCAHLQSKDVNIEEPSIYQHNTTLICKLVIDFRDSNPQSMDLKKGF